MRTTPYLTDERDRIVTRRPFWRRLLDGRLHDIVTETVPSESVLQLPDGTLVMHPAMQARLLQAVSPRP